MIDVSRLQALGIRNLRSVFGRGVRGETLARGCHMGNTVEFLYDAGVRTIIDLRTADYNEKLTIRCQKLKLKCYHIPIDAKNVSPDDIRANLQLLFTLLDGDGFYISCQQGLHRTDIAIPLYYFFHTESEVPEMFGHRTKGFFRCDDIMRRINIMRPFFPGICDDVFAERRKRFLDMNRDFPAVQNNECTLTDV